MGAGPTTIGTYRVLEQIGKGGMGSVYLAEHPLLGRRVAIKVLLPSHSANEEAVERFFNEARAVVRIADPGIVQIFDFGHDPGGQAFIVMELLEGEPMDKRLDRIGKFTLADCLRFTRLLCASLHAAHAIGIVHRDLKPENLFFVADSAVNGGERIKILDFGIAKLSGHESGTLKTRTGVLMGSPVYMSPEQCRGAGEVDHRSDIYSLGCVMFFMLTGAPPFDGAAVGELIAAHLMERPPLASSRLPELPEVIDRLLDRCLRKSPDDRPASMIELAREIDEAAQLVGASESGIPLPAVGSRISTGIPRVARVTNVHPRTPTTLVGANGQTNAIATGHGHSRGRIAGSAAGAIVLASIIAFAAAGRGSEPGPQRMPAAAPGGSGFADRAAVVDAGAPIADAPAQIGDAAAELVGDAGVPDASASNAAAPAKPFKAVDRRPRKSTSRGDHASPREPVAPVRIDRAD